MFSSDPSSSLPGSFPGPDVSMGGSSSSPSEARRASSSSSVMPDAIDEAGLGERRGVLGATSMGVSLGWVSTSMREGEDEGLASLEVVGGEEIDGFDG